MLRFHFFPSLYYNIYYLIIFTLQCQSQLKSLYAEGNEGCYMEFSAYNLLCVILHSNNNRDLVASMARCSAYCWSFECINTVHCYYCMVSLWNMHSLSCLRCDFKLEFFFLYIFGSWPEGGFPLVVSSLRVLSWIMDCVRLLGIFWGDYGELLLGFTV